MEQRQNALGRDFSTLLWGKNEKGILDSEGFCVFGSILPIGLGK
jgi:hypothetical protein